MIIVSLCVFALMFIWMFGSVIAAAIGFSCLNETMGAFYLCIGGIFSLVCWWQVMVWGEPWFKALAQVWL